MKNDEFRNAENNAVLLAKDADIYRPSPVEVLGRMYSGVIDKTKHMAFQGLKLVSIPLFLPTHFRRVYEKNRYDRNCPPAITASFSVILAGGYGVMASVVLPDVLLGTNQGNSLRFDYDGVFYYAIPQAASLAYEGFRALRNKYRSVESTLIEEKKESTLSFDLEERCLEQQYDALKTQYGDTPEFEMKFRETYDAHIMKANPGLADAIEPMETLESRVRDDALKRLRAHEEREKKFNHIQQILAKQPTR